MTQNTTTNGQRSTPQAVPGGRPGLVKQLADAISGDDSFAKDAGGGLYLYHGGRYQPRAETPIGRRVKELLEAADLTRRWSSYGTREVVAYIGVDAPELWERPPLTLINVANGLLDVQTRQLRPHRSDFLSPVQLPLNYDPAAACPAWERFVAEVFPGDARSLAFEILAWLMLPDTSIQKAVLLLGEGANGKSTYLTAVAAFLGRENITALSLHKLESDRFAAARLVGKLANICPDLPSDRLAGTSLFKALTGGDVINAERKFRDSFEFTPYARLVFSANDPPRSADASHAFFRRWVAVPFARTFEPSEQVPRNVMDSRLSEPGELSGVLNKALAALDAFRKRGGFTESESVRAAFGEFQAITDPLVVWLDAATQEAPDAMVAKDELLSRYNSAARWDGRPIMTATAFGKGVKRLRPTVGEGQRMIDGKRVWVWVGLGLGR